jgi:transcriptional regulator with PAS, ATPase and Fis domain
MLGLGDEAAMKRRKKIASIAMTITYDDGTKRKLKGSDLHALNRYVNSLIVQESVHAWDHALDLDADANAKKLDQWKAIYLEKKQKMLADRRKPRGPGKDVTPEKALETLKRITTDLDTPWASSQKTAKVLGISKRTLNRRIKKSAP